MFLRFKEAEEWAPDSKDTTRYFVFENSKFRFVQMSYPKRKVRWGALQGHGDTLTTIAQTPLIANSENVSSELLLHSYDGGESWNQIAPPPPGIIKSYTTTSDGRLFISTDKGIYQLKSYLDPTITCDSLNYNLSVIPASTCGKGQITLSIYNGTPPYKIRYKDHNTSLTII